MGTKAAVYLRSSKDRKDVSLDSQRRELEALAQAKGLEIVAEFTDVVESGKDEQRPGYQSMCAAIGQKARGWDHLLILDTSRLARRQHIAIAFSHHCQKKGIKILYAKVPEMDPINEILVLSLMRAMDEMHSHTSREKGLSGMAENVRKGFRAGGRAPIGYELVHHDTGLVREGKAVQKSVLQPGKQAAAVAAYLKARADGRPRPVAFRESGIEIAISSAVGVEWNALTYAGCTVWNVHREVGSGQGRRRPRSEWLINENTHQALITRGEAEQILRSLETSDIGRAVSAAKRGMSDYLLSGLLITPAGAQWRGMKDKSGASYRLPAAEGVRGRVVRAAELEPLVLNQLAASLQSEGFIEALYETAQAQTVDTSAAADAQRQLAALAKKIDRALDAALAMEEPAAMYRKIDVMERERKALEGMIEELKQEEELQLAAKHISRARIKELLADLAENLEDAPADQVKALLSSFLEKITLDPQSLEVQMHFRIKSDCVSMASPRQSTRYAVLRQVVKTTLVA